MNNQGPSSLRHLLWADPMKPNTVIEPILIGITVMLFAAYHIYLGFKVKNSPHKTVIGQNYEMRRLWCATMMPEVSRHIVAVQTIRNTMMASSLLASTSIALNTATFVFLINYQNIPGIHDLNLLGSEYIKPAHKLLALTICFLFAFFCYMQSIRLTNHASFQITVPIGEIKYIVPSTVASALNSAALFFTLGTRAYFFAFIVILWLFGPLPPLIGTLILIPVLYAMDIRFTRKILSMSDEFGRV